MYTWVLERYKSLISKFKSYKLFCDRHHKNLKQHDRRILDQVWSGVKVQLPLCLISLHAVEMYWGVEAWHRAYVTLAVEGSRWGASLSDRFTMNRILGGLLRPSGSSGGKKSLLLPWIISRFLLRRVHVLVAPLTRNIRTGGVYGNLMTLLLWRTGQSVSTWTVIVTDIILDGI